MTLSHPLADTALAIVLSVLVVTLRGVPPTNVARFEGLLECARPVLDPLARRAS